MLLGSIGRVDEEIDSLFGENWDPLLLVLLANETKVNRDTYTLMKFMEPCHSGLKSEITILIYGAISIAPL